MECRRFRPSRTALDVPYIRTGMDLINGCVTTRAESGGTYLILLVLPSQQDTCRSRLAEDLVPGTL